MTADPGNVTLLLNAMRSGRREAGAELESIVYGELRRIALLFFADGGLELRHFAREARFQFADIIQVAVGLHALVAG